MVLNERDRSREVIHVPRETAVVEVDHPDVVPIDQEVGQPDVGMDESEAPIALTVGVQPRGDGHIEPFELPALLGSDAQAVLPRTPGAVCTQGAVVIPARSSEPRRAPPAASVLVHTCGDGTQCLELSCGRAAAIEVGLGASQPFEQDHVSLAKFRPGHGDDSFSVGRADDARSLHDAVGAERIDPTQLRLDLGAGVVTRPMHPQREARAGARILDTVSVVLGDVAQRDRRVAIKSETLKSRARKLVDLLQLCTHLRFTARAR